MSWFLWMRKVKAKGKSLSHAQLFERVAHQAPLSMGFSRQEYWSGLPFPSPGDLPDSGIELRSPALQADSTIWATRESPWMRNPGTFNLNAIATRSLKRLQSKKKKKKGCNPLGLRLWSYVMQQGRIHFQARSCYQNSVYCWLWARGLP